MDKVRIGDSEIRVMEYIWNHAPIRAGEIVQRAREDYGWSKNTTYTMLTRLAEKELISRSEPNFVCAPLISRDDVRREETKSLIDKVYNGSRKLFLTSFLKGETLSKEEIDAIEKIIEEHK